MIQKPESPVARRAKAIEVPRPFTSRSGARLLDFYRFGPIAITLSRVRKNKAPSEMAGVARQVSPKVFVAATENFAPTGTT